MFAGEHRPPAMRLLAFIAAAALTASVPNVGLAASGDGGSAGSEEITTAALLRDEADPTVREMDRPAPDGYFSDAAFVGNSVVSGLSIYDYDGQLDGADFYAANSATAFQLKDFIEQMAGRGYGKVYIGLGTNEMSYEPRDTLRQCFADGIDLIRERDPACIIYLMSVTPVSQARSASDPKFTRELALGINEMLYALAKKKNVYYMDVYSVLEDDDGYLPADVTADGVHFTPEHYEKWFELLRTHYALEIRPEKTPPTVHKPGRQRRIYERMMEQ